MKFETIKQAERHFFKYKKLPDGFTMPDYWTCYEDKPKMGDWMLFQHIDGHKNMISPPILALIIGHTIWDMALVLEYVAEWRGWQVNSEVLNKTVNDYYAISNDNRETKHIQFWTDDILVIGKWDRKPTFYELKNALKLTKND